jgi:hypothetical protein
MNRVKEIRYKNIMIFSHFWMNIIKAIFKGLLRNIHD